MSHQRKSKIITPKDEWQTPQWLFDLLNWEFKFQTDAAAKDEETAKCDQFFNDALIINWNEYSGPFFLNPPYSAGNIETFMWKAWAESTKGCVVVCLVPCATDTKWWHNYVMKAQEIRFIRGRVRFIGYDDEGKEIRQSPQFSSCVVIFRDEDPEYRFSCEGCCNPSRGEPDGCDAETFAECRRQHIEKQPPVVGKIIEQPKKRTGTKRGAGMKASTTKTYQKSTKLVVAPTKKTRAAAELRKGTQSCNGAATLHCGTCGHYSSRVTVKPSCPRKGELLFLGGDKSGAQLLQAPL